MDSSVPSDLLKFQEEERRKGLLAEREFKEARERASSPQSPGGAFFTQQTQTEWSWLKDMEVSENNCKSSKRQFQHIKQRVQYNP